MPPDAVIELPRQAADDALVAGVGHPQAAARHAAQVDVGRDHDDAFSHPPGLNSGHHGSARAAVDRQVMPGCMRRPRHQTQQHGGRTAGEAGANGSGPGISFHHSAIHARTNDLSRTHESSPCFEVTTVTPYGFSSTPPNLTVGAASIIFSLPPGGQSRVKPGRPGLGDPFFVRSDPDPENAFPTSIRAGSPPRAAGPSIAGRVLCHEPTPRGR